MSPFHLWTIKNLPCQVLFDIGPDAQVYQMVFKDCHDHWQRGRPRKHSYVLMCHRSLWFSIKRAHPLTWMSSLQGRRFAYGTCPYPCPGRTQLSLLFCIIFRVMSFIDNSMCPSMSPRRPNMHLIGWKGGSMDIKQFKDEHFTLLLTCCMFTLHLIGMESAALQSNVRFIFSVANI